MALAAISTAHPGAGAQNTGSRVLHFPSDRCVGKLMIQDDNLQREIKDFHYWIDGAEWEYLGPAFGKVTIPAGKRVELIVSEDGWKDMSFLSALAPDDLHSLFISSGYSRGKSKPMDSCMKHLAHLTGLRMLNLRGSPITTRGMISLRGMKALERIYLPSGATNSTVKFLHVFPNLKAVYIGPNRIKDLGLTQFEGLDRLEELELGGELLTNDGLRNLRHLRSLRYLLLWGPFSDEGIVHLQAMPSLRTVRISTEQFGDAGMQALSRVPNLQAISAHWMKEITDRGVDHLTQMKNLKKLDIASARITARSVGTLARIASLEEINFGSKPFTDAQVAPLSALKNLKSLWIAARTGSPLTDKTLMMLQGLENLESLTIGGEFTDEGLMILGTMHKLKKLNFILASLRNNKVTNRGLAHLGGLGNLEYLSMGNIENCTLSGLGALPLDKVKAIKIGDIKQDYKGMNLSGMTSLEDLIITTWAHREDGKLIRDPFTDDDLKSLANLKRLRRIQLPHTGITDRGIACLSGLENAEFINLGGDGITDDGLGAISNLPKLNRLIIDGRITDVGLKHLETMRALTWLEIRSPHSISRQAIQQLQNKLPYLITLRVKQQAGSIK